MQKAKAAKSRIIQRKAAKAKMPPAEEELGMQRMQKAKAKKPKIAQKLRSQKAKKPRSRKAKKPKSQKAKKPKSQEAKKPRSQEAKAKKPKSQEAKKPRSQKQKKRRNKNTPPLVSSVRARGIELPQPALNWLEIRTEAPPVRPRPCGRPGTSACRAQRLFGACHLGPSRMYRRGTYLKAHSPILDE